MTNKEIEYAVSMGAPTPVHTLASVNTAPCAEYTAYIWLLVVVLFIYVYSKVIKYIRKVYFDKVNIKSKDILTLSEDISDSICRTWSNKEHERGGNSVEYCTYCYGDKTAFGTKSFVHDNDCPVISALVVNRIIKEMRDVKSIR